MHFTAETLRKQRAAEKCKLLGDRSKAFLNFGDCKRLRAECRNQSNGKPGNFVGFSFRPLVIEKEEIV
jgi:hypothetical protein